MFSVASEVQKKWLRAIVGMQSMFLQWPIAYIIIADDYETPNVLEHNGLSGHVF